MSVYKRLEELGYKLPPALSPVGLYLPVNRVGNLIYISGQGSIENGVPITGKVGRDISVEQGVHGAEVCILNTLALIHNSIGDLNKVKSIVKLLGFISCTDDFERQAEVMNGASKILIDIFGEKGKHARSAIGANVLPMNLAVEIESIFEIE